MALIAPCSTTVDAASPPLRPTSLALFFWLHSWLLCRMLGRMVIDPSRRKRRFHARSKSGCLTCRARRKRCTEEKPVCIGCSRNFLLCSWPSPPSPSLRDGADEETICPGLPGCGISGAPGLGLQGKQITLVNVPIQHSRHADFESGICLGPGDPSLCLESLFATSSAHSKALAFPREQQLFQHFLESTSGMLAARGSRNNPFVTCLLPLAMTNDGIMHTILAISASHYTSALGDDSLYALGRQHYAVAIRCAKHQITRFARGMCNQPLVLAALLLSLCEFEVIPSFLPVH